MDKIDSPVKIFRLTTVTYGSKSASYLETRLLKQLAIDNGDKYPLVAEVIMSDVYMDDFLTGADDLESGRKLQVQLVSMLKGAGMEFHTSGQLVIHYYYQTLCVKLRTSFILLQPRPRSLDSYGSHILIPLLSRFLP
ncbi:integrase catalytic domain-containing protein [Trichonephila clavipes]|nr:integrase catalytic domain-containing protein [Trichonephila clavipes]